MATGGGLTALLVLMCALPFLVALYRLDILIFMLINVILAISYRFLTLAGEYSLGHVVMMGVGAYGSALATKEAGISFWLAAPLAMAFTGLLALLLAFPLFRMKGFYFLIGSFAAGEAIRLTWNRFRDPFGGPGGIVYIPFAGDSPPRPRDMFDIAADARAYYFFTLAIVDHHHRHLLPAGALALRAHAARDPLAGRAGRIGRRAHLVVQDLRARGGVGLRRARRQRSSATTSAQSTRPSSTCTSCSSCWCG